MEEINSTYKQYAKELLSSEDAEEKLAEILLEREVNREWKNMTWHIRQTAATVLDSVVELIHESDGKPGFMTDDQITQCDVMVHMLRYTDSYFNNNFVDPYRKLQKINEIDLSVLPYRERQWK